MTIDTFPTDTYFEFKVPSLRKDRTPIPENVRKEVFKHIVRRCIAHNGGADVISCIGYYLSQDGEVMEEHIDIVRTQGGNPFDDEDIKYFTKYLAQECIMINFSTGHTSSLISVNSAEEGQVNDRILNPDGTYIERIDVTSPFSAEKEFIEVENDVFGFPLGHKYTQEDNQRIDDELDQIYAKRYLGRKPEWEAD